MNTHSRMTERWEPNKINLLASHAIETGKLEIGKLSSGGGNGSSINSSGSSW